MRRRRVGRSAPATHRPGLLITLLAGLLLACSGGQSGRQVRVTLLGSSTASPGNRGASVRTPPPTVTAFGSFRIAATTTDAGSLEPLLRELAAQYPKLKLSLVVEANPGAAARSGADLAVEKLTPGSQPAASGPFIRREPFAIMLPLTQSPDDVTLAQAVDLLTGGVADWSQLGGSSRPVRLALSDPPALEHVGGLVGHPDAHLAPARTAAAAALLAETDASTDEAVAVPWTGPRLRSKPLRIDGRLPDDADYPLATLTLLAPLRKEAEPVAAQLAPLLAVRLAPPRDGTVAIDAVGDVMLGRGVAVMAQRRGADWPFDAVQARLASADIRFGNLEFAFTDRGEQARKDFTFRAPPAAADGLMRAGFDVVCLANNHVMDYGAPGLLDTLATLGRAGVAHAGAGGDAETAHAPVLTETNGVKIAWLAYANVPDDGVTGFVARSLEAVAGRPGVAWGTVDAVRRDVAGARQLADVVIVALHSGFEYTSEPNSTQRDLAHAAIDAGAALVLGAHPHVLQGIELYHGGLIAYSLGNFVFDLDQGDLAQTGLPSVLTVILRVVLDVHGVTGIEVYPAIINRNDFRPEPVLSGAARPVYDRLYKLTAALNR